MRWAGSRTHPRAAPSRHRVLQGWSRGCRLPCRLHAARVPLDRHAQPKGRPVLRCGLQAGCDLARATHSKPFTDRASCQRALASGSLDCPAHCMLRDRLEANRRAYAQRGWRARTRAVRGTVRVSRAAGPRGSARPARPEHSRDCASQGALAPSGARTSMRSADGCPHGLCPIRPIRTRVLSSLS